MAYAGRMRHLALALAVVLVAVTSARAVERQPPRSVEALRARVGEALARNGVPGAGLALVTRDRVVWAGGVGLADRANGTPVTADTLFRVGSITKSFIALALVKLADEGRIRLDARVADLAPELVIANRWQQEAPITVAHVVEHTAGFDDMHFNETYGPLAVETLTPLQVLARNPASRVARWRPGSRFSYANPGYTVAAHLVEKASGRGWRDYLRDELLLPLGMTTAALAWSPDVDRRLARGYDDGVEALPYRAIYHAPAGNLMASPRELAALAQLWLARGRVGGRQLVSPDGLARTERSETNAVRGLDGDYGLGNYGDTTARVRLRGHTGGIDGFISACFYAPDRDVGFVILLNSTGRHAFDAMMETRALVVDYLVRDAPPPPPAVDSDERELRAWTGDYGFASPRHQLFAFLSPLSPALQLEVRGGRLHLGQHPRARLDVALVPLGDGRFRFPERSGSHVALAHDGDGRRVLVVDNAYFVAQPRWLAPLGDYATRAVSWLMLSALALPLAALAWRRRGARVGWRWPMLALVSFQATPLLFVAAAERRVLGERNALTVGVCVATIVFAVAAVASLARALAGLRQPLPVVVRAHRLLVAVALATAAGYAAWFGLVGICTWRY